MNLPILSPTNHESPRRPPLGRGFVCATSFAGPVFGLAALLLAGCVAPIGADRVTTRQAYAQVDANALRTGKPSGETVSILHRYDLDRLAARQPDEAVRQLTRRPWPPASATCYLRWRS